MLTTYLGSLSRAVLESREGAQAVSHRINHSPGHIVGPSVIWRPVTLLLLLPWIQLGWSKSQTAGEADTGGVHWAGLRVFGEHQVGSTPPWGAQLAGRWRSGRCFPHYTLPPPSSCHRQAGRGPVLAPATRLSAWLPVPPSPTPPVCLLAAAFCPQKTRSPRGLCQASSRCSGSGAPPWELSGHGLGEPQVEGALIQAHPAP